MNYMYLLQINMQALFSTLTNHNKILFAEYKMPRLNQIETK